MNVKEIDGKAFSPNDPFPPTAYLQPFVRENTDAGLIFDPDQFVRAYHPSESFKKAFEEVQSTGTSCGRTMFWSILDIPPNRGLSLHAHPNVEIAFVLKGVLHQNLIVNIALEKDKFCLDDVKKDSWGPGAPKFALSEFHQGQVVLNEPGSIHQTFTVNDGAVILCLISGHWVHIESEHASVREALKMVSFKRNERGVA